eukprot:UN32904
MNPNNGIPLNKPMHVPFMNGSNLIPNNSDPGILVVGIIGTTNGFPNKTIVTNNLFRKNVFSTHPPEDPYKAYNKQRTKSQSNIDLMEDYEEGIIYLQLSNINDVYMFSDIVNKLENTNSFDFSY